MAEQHDVWQWVLMSGVAIAVALNIWRMFAMHGQSVREQTSMRKDVDRIDYRQKEDREAIKELRDKSSDSFSKVFEKLDHNARALAEISGHLKAIINLEKDKR